MSKAKKSSPTSANVLKLPQETFDPLTSEIKPEFVPVDEWQPSEEDKIFRTSKGIIMADVSSFFGCEENRSLNAFIMSPKRAYNNPKMRTHTVHYLNYFEKFYDIDHELLTIYCRLKYMIDYEPLYTKEAFFYDLNRFILHGSIAIKVGYMNRDNYTLSLTYKNKRNPSLQYSDRHAQLLMKISVLMNCMIPLLCHFMYMRKVSNISEFLLEIYDDLIHINPDIDIWNKLYETASSNVMRSAKRNAGIWNLQDIRGINTTIHSSQCVQNILINIVCKYLYSENLIHFNYESILRNTGFQILDIEYEYNFIPLSSSHRDEDLNSDFDKFESFLTKTDEALYIQNQVACKDGINIIKSIYGPFDQEEINFYKKRLQQDSLSAVNSLQRDLIYNLFFKYFKDPTTINAINLEEYVILILSAKKILESSGMILLPYIISSKVIRVATRKTINKKELTRLKNSPQYETIRKKYRDDKILKYILGLIATILSSEFEIIDIENPDLDGLRINVIPELIEEEILTYINLI